MSRDFYRALARRASRRYGAADPFARHFAFGKLTRDPIFCHLLESGVIPREARIVDLGCGQGLLEALFAACEGDAGPSTPGGPPDWPTAWARPPAPRTMHGIDLAAKDVRRARTAGGRGMRFDRGDIRTAAFDEADAFVLLDVLHYLEPEAQDRVLDRVRSKLAPGGIVVARVADASRSLRFRMTLAADRLALRLRGRAPPAYHCRPLGAWREALEARGLEVEVRPMSAGTPFANALLVARDLPGKR